MAKKPNPPQEELKDETATSPETEPKAAATKAKPKKAVLDEPVSFAPDQASGRGDRA